MSASPIPVRTRDAILQSLRAGVVPRRGLEHIQVGRAREIEALLADVERVAASGSAFRFVIGEYGSGKTFFLHLVRSIALEKRLVQAFEELLATPLASTHPSYGDALRLHLLRLYRETRADGKRAAMLRDLGFLVAWRIIGPFDNERGGGFEREFGPEKELVLDRTYDGKKRAVAARGRVQQFEERYKDLDAGAAQAKKDKKDKKAKKAAPSKTAAAKASSATKARKK